MKIKKYHFSKRFIGALVLIIFMAWLVLKCVPLTEKEQDAHIREQVERQRLGLAQEFDSYTPEDLEKLPKFDARKYALIKRNNRFWLIPREYFGDGGFNIFWPTTVNKILKKKWLNETDEKYPYVKVFMYSRQYSADDYTRNENFSKKEPCINQNYWFTWNGINIRLYEIYAPNLNDKQYLDVCLTALKILNEEIKEIHFIN